MSPGLSRLIQLTPPLLAGSLWSCAVLASEAPPAADRRFEFDPAVRIDIQGDTIRVDVVTC